MTRRELLASMALASAAALGWPRLVLAQPGREKRQKAVTVKGITYVTTPTRQMADLYLPSSGGAHPVVVYPVDGGFRSSDRTMTQAVTAAGRLSQDEDFACLVIEVRTAPTYHSPAPQDDCAAAVQWVVSHASQYNLDANRIAAMGGSGGGHMASYMATKKRLSASNAARLRCAVAGSPPQALWLTDDDGISAEGYQFCVDFVGVPEAGHLAEWQAASPMHQISDEFAPLFVAHSLDDQIPYAQATRMQAALNAGGIQNQLYSRAGSLHGSSLLLASDVWPGAVAWLHQYLG